MEWESLVGQPDLGAESDSNRSSTGSKSGFTSKPQHPAVGRRRQSPCSKRGHDDSGGDTNTTEERRIGASVQTNACHGVPDGSEAIDAAQLHATRTCRFGARCLTEVRIARRLWLEGGRCVGVHRKGGEPAHTSNSDIDVRVRVEEPSSSSCGAVQTPYSCSSDIESGSPSRQIGKNFLCHPNAKVVAIYPLRLSTLGRG